MIKLHITYKIILKKIIHLYVKKYLYLSIKNIIFINFLIEPIFFSIKKLYLNISIKLEL